MDELVLGIVGTNLGIDGTNLGFSDINPGFEANVYAKHLTGWN